jgi:outer membrane receptor protein involved in Fe transport
MKLTPSNVNARFTCKIAVFLCMCFGMNSQLLAQADTLDLYQLSIGDLKNTRVSATSKVLQKQSETPGITNFYEKEMIDRFGWISVNDILYRTAGFAPSQDYDRRTVSVRGVFEGWNNNHLLMLIDGVQYNDNLYGTAYTWEITPLIFTKSIEVVRGPSSALYGTNAVNGIVSINTLSPADLEGGHGMAQVRIGSQGTRIYDILGTASTKLVDITGAFNFYQTDGNSYSTYEDSFREDADGNTLQFKTNDERESNYFFAKLEGKDKLSGFSLQYHEHHWQFGTGHGWLFNVPDQPESMKEFRRIINLKYNNASKKQPLIQEYSLRYQKHGIDWRMRFFPDSAFAFDIFYPSGVSEYLRTSATDILGRAQFTFNLLRGSALLGGIETNVFIYNGDEEHNSNIDLESTFNPFPNNEFRPMKPWFEFVLNEPVQSSGVFVQYISPKFSNKLQLTFSLRSDLQSFTYTDIYDEDRKKQKKTFNQVSPRLAVVYNATDKLTLKLLAGRAFRTPSPTEMFGANTFTLLSNISELKAEVISTIELNANWQISENIDFNLVGFYNAQFDDIIAYSVANANLSTNLYSLSTAGLELDMNWSKNNFSGFVNYSLNKRIKENIVDNTISEDQNNITWVPAQTANIGLSYKRKKGYLSSTIHYQGVSKRRDSDIKPDTEVFRNNEVGSWITLDAKIALTLIKNIEMGFLLQNALNQDGFLQKNNAYRFDYRINERRLMGNLLVKF